jgi:hypothetical protein
METSLLPIRNTGAFYMPPACGRVLKSGNKRRLAAAQIPGVRSAWQAHPAREALIGKSVRPAAFGTKHRAKIRFKSAPSAGR